MICDQTTEFNIQVYSITEYVILEGGFGIVKIP